MFDLALSLSRGCAAGVAEVCPVGHLLWAASTLQSNGQLTRKAFDDPRTLLRVARKGLGTNICGMVSSTATQVVGNDLFHRALYGSAKPTHSQAAFTATLAGFVSGLFMGPLELAMTQMQQAEKAGSRWSFRDHTSQHGLRSLFRGTPLITVRDAGYTCCWKALYPWLKEQTDSKAVATLVAGTTACAATQPFSTVKSIQQAQNNGQSAWSVARNLVRKDGWRGLFAGYLPRQLRIYWAVFAIGEVEEHLRTLQPGDKAR